MSDSCTDKRLTCVLLGCATRSNEPFCARCYTDLYDPDFMQYGKLEPLFQFYWRVRSALRKLTRRKCEVCKKKFWRGYSDHTCSEDCFNDWLPF